MRAAVISTAGPGSIPGHHEIKTYKLFPECGFNTGNLAFWGAIDRHIVSDKGFIPWSFNPDDVRANYDILVFPATNQINEENDLGYFADCFERTNLPCVILGLGAQASKIGDKLEISAGTRRWLHVIAERSTKIGVRGAYTAEVLAGFGIHNVEIVGCPSFFINDAKTLGRDIEDRLLKPVASLAICQGEFYSRQIDVERKLFEWLVAWQGAYICQAPEKVISLARGRFEELSEEDIDAIRRYLCPEMPYAEFMLIARNSFKVFFEFDEWLNYLSRYDLSIGSRLHGNILAIQAGVPGIVIPHDSRTSELAQTGCLPTLASEKFLQCADLEEAKQSVEFDGAAFDKARQDLASRMAGILQSVGLRLGKEISALALLDQDGALHVEAGQVSPTEAVINVKDRTLSDPFVEAGVSKIHPLHPRVEQIWPRYQKLGTRLRGRIFYSDILQPNDQWNYWNDQPAPVVPLTEQRPENYHDTHNHYQLLLSEAINFTLHTNAIPIWGDGWAIANESGAWGALFTARSSYHDPENAPRPALGSFAPEGYRTVPRSEFDCQLTGLEVDVLNDGKPGVFPNKAKYGIQIVGFGNPNSHALSVICENFNCLPEMRKGQFESGIYFQNSIHPDYGRLLVSDFDTAHIGLDMRRTVFRWGAVQIKGAGPGTGIVFDEAKGGEIYTGTRWVGLDSPQWMTIRLAEQGLRIITPDGTRELVVIDPHGGIYLNGDLYLNGRKCLATADEQSPGSLVRQIATVLLRRILGWLQPAAAS